MSVSADEAEESDGSYESSFVSKSSGSADACESESADSMFCATDDEQSTPVSVVRRKRRIVSSGSDSD